MRDAAAPRSTRFAPSRPISSSSTCRCRRLDGFAVVEEIGVARMPIVIFVTAFDAYAVRAFESHAIDYVLKPIDDARFADTLLRVRARVRDRAASTLAAQLAATLAQLASARTRSHPALPCAIAAASCFSTRARWRAWPPTVTTCASRRARALPRCARRSPRWRRAVSAAIRAHRLVDHRQRRAHRRARAAAYNREFSS